MTIRIPFDNSYARLPDRFYTRLAPTPVAKPALVAVNEALARDLGIDPAALATTTASRPRREPRPDGADPLAQAYAGHQFGDFVPQLGDGRAILLGEVVDAAAPPRHPAEGRGPHALLARGDGRAALGPVLREYIVSAKRCTPSASPPPARSPP